MIARSRTSWDQSVVWTLGNRCFPTKAIRGWLVSDDRAHVSIVRRYFELTGAFGEPVAQVRASGSPGDPLHAVWAFVSPATDQEGDR